MAVVNSEDVLLLIHHERRKCSLGSVNDLLLLSKRIVIPNLRRTLGETISAELGRHVFVLAIGHAEEIYSVGLLIVAFDQLQLRLLASVRVYVMLERYGSGRLDGVINSIIIIGIIKLTTLKVAVIVGAHCLQIFIIIFMY